MKRKLSRSEFEDLQNELKKLDLDLKQNAKDISYAKSQGDLSENAEYEDAKEEQGRILREIDRINSILKSYEIVEANTSVDEVNIGHKITIQSLHTGETELVNIIGYGDGSMDKATAESPFGTAVIGKHIGDTFTVHTDLGEELSYKILNIDFS